MVCASCGIKNVEFASTCFACGRSLGSSRTLHRASAVPAAEPQPMRLPGAGGVASAVRVVRALVRIAIALVIVGSVAGGLPQIKRAIETMLEAAREEPTAPPTESVESSPSGSSAVAQAPGEAVDEQNGFQLTHFSLTLPEGREGGHFRVGETVRGRSEIKGFEVNAKGELDVTITFAFRDPNGALVEPISPNVLRQKAESDTLYTDFYYDVAAGATEGHYDLELGVDDAVSGRSVRFHRTIPIDPAGEPS